MRKRMTQEGSDAAERDLAERDFRQGMTDGYRSGCTCVYCTHWRELEQVEAALAGQGEGQR